MASLTRRAQLAVAVTCLIASVCFAGAVTERALLGFVVPGVALGCAAAALFIANRQLRSAVVTGLIVAIVWSEIANVVTGASNGPAARSSVVAAAGAALAMTLAASRFPSAFLLPVGGIVLGAVLLGAGGEVRVVAMVTAAAAVVTLAIVESSYRCWVRPPDTAASSRRWSVGVVAALIAAVAALTAVTQAHHDARSPHASINGTENTLVHPSWSDPFPKTAGARSSVGSQPRPHHHRARHASANPPPATHKQQHHNVFLFVLLAILSLLLLIAIAIVIRLAIVQRAWVRTRKQLRRRSTAGVVGAWIWARLRLRAYRMPLPQEVSPDLLPRREVDLGRIPHDSAQPLRQLAQIVVPAAFGAGDDKEFQRYAKQAWLLSDEACAAAEATLSRLGKARLRLKSPPRFERTVGIQRISTLTDVPTVLQGRSRS